MIGALARIGRALASLWVTLAGLAAAAVVALAGQGGALPVGIYIALPFAVLFLNLVAALATTPALRRQGGLLAFHLALAGLALLIAADRLMAFYGHVEVSEGAAFDPALVEASAGPLHPWRLDEVRFAQGSFEIAYDPGMKRRGTVSEIFVPAGRIGWQRVVVGDDRPLIAAGYRFYTSFNKGFAPLLTYVTPDGLAHSGAVHLPSYPLNYFKQGNDWVLPGTEEHVKLWLHVPQPVYDEARSWRFAKPKDARLVLIEGGRRHELRPGQSVRIHGGLLRYDALRSWMGYTISYNPLVPWMLAAVALGVLAFAWHAVTKLRGTPWDPEPPRGGYADAG
ncbi:MAG: hypothetical protein ACE5FR_04655 [Rhodospirillales bacterium]